MPQELRTRTPNGRPRHAARRRGLLVMAVLTGLGCLGWLGVAAASASGMSPTYVSVFDASGLRFEPPIEASGWRLSLSGPDGFYLRRELSGAPTLSLFEATGALPIDGSYIWELRPIDSAKSSYAAVQTGHFRVIGGVVVLPDHSVPERAAATTTGGTDAGAPIELGVPPNHTGDFYIDGRLAFGTAITGTESIGFGSLLVKEDNIRLRFDDPSVSSGFPTRNWQITVNDSFMGGADYFAIEELTAATVPFRIDGLAPSDSLYVDQNGRVGLGLNVPATTLHVMGDTTLDGELTVLSAREAKERFAPVNADAVLASLVQLPVLEWSYRGDTATRHLGPTAEDFHDAFHLGSDARSINPLDLSGVTLVAIQRLQAEIVDLEGRSDTALELLADRDRQIARLETDRDTLEQRIEALETRVRELADREPESR